MSIEKIKEYNFKKWNNKDITVNHNEEGYIKDLLEVCTVCGIIKSDIGYRKSCLDNHKKVFITVRVISDELVKRDVISKKEAVLFSIASLYHDIGKCFVPKNILEKPSKLNKREREIVEKHVENGIIIFMGLPEEFRGSYFCKILKNMIQYHHVYWNGGGYPDFGVRWEEIPLEARICSIADVYDALVSERCYKLPKSHEAAIRIIEEYKYERFDPMLTDIFIKNNKKIKSLYNNYDDDFFFTELLEKIFLEGGSGNLCSPGSRSRNTQVFALSMNEKKIKNLNSSIGISLSKYKTTKDEKYLIDAFVFNALHYFYTGRFASALPESESLAALSFISLIFLEAYSRFIEDDFYRNFQILQEIITVRTNRLFYIMTGEIEDYELPVSIVRSDCGLVRVLKVSHQLDKRDLARMAVAMAELLGQLGSRDHKVRFFNRMKSVLGEVGI